MSALLPILLSCMSWSGSLPPGILATLSPVPTQAPVVALSGNTKMVIGVAANSAVSEFHWPSPGYYDQLQRHLPAAVPGWPQGLVWGIQFPAQPVTWLDQAAWTAEDTTSEAGVITQRLRLPDGTEIVHRAFVHFEFPALVTQILIEATTDTPPKLFWYGGLGAAARLWPQLPVIPGVLGAATTAVYIDENKIRSYHAADSAQDSESRRRAQRLNEADALPAEWAVFEGTVLGCDIPAGAVAWACITPEDAPALRASPEVLFAGPDAAVGTASSLAMITPQREGAHWRAAVVIAAGPSRAEADKVLDHVREQNLDSLAASVQSISGAKQVLIPAPLLGKPGLLEAAAMLRLCTDSVSKAIVRAPIASPPMDVDEPRTGIWLSHAMDLLGWTDQARAHLEFYGRAIRSESAPGRPYGSLPAALYTDGQEAAPPFILATDAPAWFLSACWRHGLFLDWGARQTFLQAVAEPMGRAMDFLARWTLNVQNVPLASYDPDALRETHDIHWLLLAYMGLDSGLQAFRVLNQTPPEEWVYRHRELQAALRFHVLNAAGIVDASPWLPYWLREILSPEDRVWELQLATDEGPVLFRDAAIPGPDSPEGGLPPADALAAAYQIIRAVRAPSGPSQAQP